MPMQYGQPWLPAEVMTVAVSNDQAGVGIIDSVNQKIKGTQGL